MRVKSYSQNLKFNREINLGNNCDKMFFLNLPGTKAAFFSDLTHGVVKLPHHFHNISEIIRSQLYKYWEVLNLTPKMQAFNRHNLILYSKQLRWLPTNLHRRRQWIVSRENSKVSATYRYFLNATFVLHICTFACSHT